VIFMETTTTPSHSGAAGTNPENQLPSPSDEVPSDLPTLLTSSTVDCHLLDGRVCTGIPVNPQEPPTLEELPGPHIDEW